MNAHKSQSKKNSLNILSVLSTFKKYAERTHSHNSSSSVGYLVSCPKLPKYGQVSTERRDRRASDRICNRMGRKLNSDKTTHIKVTEVSLLPAFSDKRNHMVVLCLLCCAQHKYVKLQGLVFKKEGLGNNMRCSA